MPKEPYSAKIDRSNPTCFVFLIDQSKSMEQSFGRQPEKRKADGVADVLNRFLYNLTVKCATGKSQGVREYFQIGVIGFGKQVGPALGGKLAGRELVPIGEIGNEPLRVEDRVKEVDDGHGGLTKKTIKFPVWIEPRAEGDTPLAEALQLARRWISGFLAKHPACFPPIAICVTDGMPNKGDPQPDAKALKELSSSDGNVLLFNIHVSDKTTRPIEFPAAESELPDKFATLLYRMSSVMPQKFVTAAQEEGYPATEQSRGFVFNGDLVAMVKFLNVGTVNTSQSPQR